MSPEDAVAIDRDALTPQQRLALSRRALFRQPAPVPDEAYDAPLEAAETSAARGGQPMASAFSLQGLPWLDMGRSVALRWWRRHPANAACQLARPVLQRFAEERPGRLIAVAAGTGALVVLVKPWRLLSVTAVLAMLLKTSDVADMVTTLMQRDDERR
jgi:hypothetical protein